MLRHTSHCLHQWCCPSCCQETDICFCHLNWIEGRLKPKNLNLKCATHNMFLFSQDLSNFTPQWAPQGCHLILKPSLKLKQSIASCFLSAEAKTWVSSVPTSGKRDWTPIGSRTSNACNRWPAMHTHTLPCASTTDLSKCLQYKMKENDAKLANWASLSISSSPRGLDLLLKVACFNSCTQEQSGCPIFFQGLIPRYVLTSFS